MNLTMDTRSPCLIQKLSHSNQAHLVEDKNIETRAMEVVMAIISALTIEAEDVEADMADIEAEEENTATMTTMWSMAMQEDEVADMEDTEAMEGNTATMTNIMAATRDKEDIHLRRTIVKKMRSTTMVTMTITTRDLLVEQVAEEEATIVKIEAMAVVDITEMERKEVALVSTTGAEVRIVLKTNSEAEHRSEEKMKPKGQKSIEIFFTSNFCYL